MSQQKYPKAYEAYQQAVYRDGRNPTFWCSIGVLYYQINQYRDALDAYSRAIRLNPYISEVWYDLGTLVRLLSILRIFRSTAPLTACFSTSHVIIKSTMPWMHINAQQSSTQPTSISRLASSCCAAARVARHRPPLPCLRMSIPKRTRPAEPLVLPVLSGEILHPRPPKAPQAIPRSMDGAADSQNSIPLLNPRTHTIVSLPAVLSRLLQALPAPGWITKAGSIKAPVLTVHRHHHRRRVERPLVITTPRWGHTPERVFHSLLHHHLKDHHPSSNEHRMQGIQLLAHLTCFLLLLLL